MKLAGRVPCSHVVSLFVPVDLLPAWRLTELDLLADLDPGMIDWGERTMSAPLPIRLIPRLAERAWFTPPRPSAGDDRQGPARGSPRPSRSR